VPKTLARRETAWCHPYGRGYAAGVHDPQYKPTTRSLTWVLAPEHPEQAYLGSAPAGTITERICQQSEQP